MSVRGFIWVFDPFSPCLVGKQCIVVSANGERLLHRHSKCISFHVFVNNGRVYLNFTRFADSTQAQVNIVIECLFFYDFATHFVLANCCCFSLSLARFRPRSFHVCHSFTCIVVLDVFTYKIRGQRRQYDAIKPNTNINRQVEPPPFIYITSYSGTFKPHEQQKTHRSHASYVSD